MSVLLGEPTKYGGFARSPEPGGAGFEGRARAAASFARRENPIQFGSNLLDNEIFDEEIAAVARETGVKIPHPVKGRFPEAEEEIAARAQRLRELGFRGESVEMARREVQKRLYDQKIAELKARFPAAAAFKAENSFDERRKRRARTFEKKASEGGLAANIFGGLIAAPSDPVTVATAPVGFTAKTVGGAFIKNAVANAAIELAVQPGVQARREEIGLEASFEQGAVNVFAAGIFGGGLGAGGKLLVDAVGAGKRAFTRAETAAILKDAEDPELRAGAAELTRELEIEADVEAASGPLDAAGKAAARDRIDAADRIIDAAEAGDAPARRDIEAVRGDGPPIEARAIRDDVAVTTRGREVDVAYAIVDLDDLIASHDLSLSRNPRFPAELQPRDRGRAASAAQIADIAANLNPKLLDRSNAAGDGAPVIRADGVVLSGNGRVLGIARAYEKDMASAAAYRDYLKAQNYPVDGVARPVLVRVARDLDDVDGFAREANERATAAMSAPEQARADAANLKAEDFALLDGDDPSAVKNARFIRAIAGRIAPEAERAALMDARGALSAEGTRRIRNAIAAYAYDDAALIGRLLEAEDELKGVGLALIDAAPDFARLRGEIEAGAVDPRVDVRAYVAEAAAIVGEARRSGRNVAEFVGQQDMFSGVVDPRTVAFLRLFFNKDDFTGPRARSRIAEELGFYVREARKVDAAPGLFGQDGDPAARLLAAIRARAESGDADAPGLFDPRGDAGTPSLLRDAGEGSGAPQPPGAGEGDVAAASVNRQPAIADFDDPLAPAAKKADGIEDINIRALDAIEAAVATFKKKNGELSAVEISEGSRSASPDPDRYLARYLEAGAFDLIEDHAIRDRLMTTNIRDLETGEFLTPFEDGFRGGHVFQIRTAADDVRANPSPASRLDPDETFLTGLDADGAPQPPVAGEGAVGAASGNRESAIADFDDPLAPAAKAARDAEIKAALDEIDPNPEGALVTGSVDVDADGRILARTQTRADLEAEFAADAAIVARLKGCVT